VNEQNLPEDSQGDLAEALQNVPEEKRKLIINKMSHSFTMGMMRSEKSAEEILVSKMTSENIDTYLKNRDKETECSFKDRCQNRRFVIAIVVIAAILFAVVIFVFQDSPELVERIIFAIGGAIVGFAGGFGFGKTKRDE
jgi:hypothetical protein